MIKRITKVVRKWFFIAAFRHKEPPPIFQEERNKILKRFEGDEKLIDLFHKLVSRFEHQLRRGECADDVYLKFILIRAKSYNPKIITGLKDLALAMKRS